MRKILFLISFLFINHLLLFSQCVEAPLFSLPDSLCLGESVNITSLQGGFEQYEWDFFSGDIIEGNIENTVDHGDLDGEVIGIKGISVVEENNSYYGFIVMNNPIKIIRVDFGTSLENIDFFNYTDLGNPFNVLNAGNTPLRFYENYGFISNENSIVRLDFTNGLGNPPTNFEEITNSALEEFNTPSKLRIVNDRDSIFLLVCNGGNPRHISVLTYGSNINTQPTLVKKILNLNTVNSTRFAVDLDLVKKCGKWLGYYFLNNGQFVILDFGSSLSHEPIKQLSNSINVSGPRFLKVFQDEGKVFLALKRNNRNLFIYDMGFNGDNLDATEILNQQVTPTGNPQGFDLIKYQSAWMVFTGDGNDNIFTSTFENISFLESSISNDEIISEFPYSSPGSYYISLKVIDSLDNVSTQIDTIEILNNIIPSFSFDQSCVDNPIVFSESVILNGLEIENREWQFGNGDTSILENPSYQYSNTGMFPVEFILTANNGCQSIFSDSVFITDTRPENPSFEFTPNVICENTLIEFSNITTTIIDSVVAVDWDFGDGNTSIDENPSHAYTQAGDYIVVMKVTGKFGCDTSISQTINVRPGPVPNFQFDNLCFGDTTEFTDVSSSIPPSQIVSWEWDFGDSSLPSNTPNTNHFYQNNGNYDVMLTVETDSGCIATSSQVITIESLPNSDFFSPIACAMTATNFESITTTNITSWLWELADETYIGNNAEIFIESEGFTDITLTTTSNNGCLSSTTKTIEVFPALLPDFNAENLCFGDSIQFLDATSSFSNVEWLWNFGQPNAFSFDQNPKYFFNQAGVYNVSLSVQNAIGCENTIVKAIQIFEPPVAQIAHDTACSNQDFYVWNNSITDFGDSVIHLFWLQSDTVFANNDSILLNLSGDDFALTLEIETQSGCKSETSKNININETPEVDFTFSPNYGTAPQTVEFENLSDGLVAYVWDFGDGSSEVFEENPVHIYQQNGEYTIQFIGFNEFGCSNLLQKEIPVVPSELDIEVRSVSLQQEILSNGSIKITPTVVLFNNGTRLIEKTDLYIQLDGQSNVSETWIGELNIGNTITYTFNSFYVISEVYDAQRICIEAQNVNDNTEVNFSNNKACVLIKGLFSISNPYPNPVTQTLNIDVVTADQGVADLSIYDLNGKILWQQNNTLINEGFNKITIDTRDFMSGKYFFKISYLNDDYLISFIVID